MVNTLELINDFIFLYPLLMSLVWMIGGLLFFWRRERKSKQPPKLQSFPFFSILVPCHNEEKQINDTVAHLLNLDYPNFEVILLDDGSSDATADMIRDLCRRHDRVRAIYIKENQGKAAALNVGTMASKGELVLTVDADALIDPNALRWMAWHFATFAHVGAVTGNPRILNRTSLLAKVQTGEYATIIGLIKRTQRLWGKVLTVSGAIAAFRKSALISAGLWSTDMITEDIDITWKLEKKAYDIRYEPRAVCWIYAPETFRGLLRQRLRWAQGGVEVLKKHKGVWSSWRQRRLWLVYMESLTSIVWSYCFWGMVLLWLVVTCFSMTTGIKTAPPMPPAWTGSILALTCVMQFTVSLYVDHSYEKKIFRYLFWVIWYPFAFWMLGSFSVVLATPKALFKKKGVRAVWKSPDRGIGKS